MQSWNGTYFHHTHTHKLGMVKSTITQILQSIIHDIHVVNKTTTTTTITSSTINPRGEREAEMGRYHTKEPCIKASQALLDSRVLMNSLRGETSGSDDPRGDL